VRVIGVIADVHESSIESASNPEVYVPMTQNADAEGATLVVRTRVDPRVVASLLFSTSPRDAPTLIVMTLGLATVALVSGYFPARRASRVSPMTALRSNQATIIRWISSGGREFGSRVNGSNFWC
jgi:ABC-type lipoprotein release transport system permease subunit